jgi:hypothetical protein
MQHFSPASAPTHQPPNGAFQGVSLVAKVDPGITGT